MRKNFILTLLPILILASVQLSNAQQTKKATIGILTLASDDPLAKVLREGLRDLGYVDNDRVKVYEGRFSPGEKSPQMSKRPDRVEFAMTDGHMRHYHADGKVEEVKWKAGDVKWFERATYQQENIGTSEFRIRVVQLK